MKAISFFLGETRDNPLLKTFFNQNNLEVTTSTKESCLRYIHSTITLRFYRKIVHFPVGHDFNFHPKKSNHVTIIYNYLQFSFSVSPLSISLPLLSILILLQGQISIRFSVSVSSVRL